MFVTLACGSPSRPNASAVPERDLPQSSDVIEEIRSAAHLSDRAFELLTALCSGFGPRLSGSRNLDEAIRWAHDTLLAAHHDNVRVDPVQVTKWVRGAESLVLQPGDEALAMIGLGQSVGTPPQGIEGELIVVSDWDDLQRQAAVVAGKIVLFDVRMLLRDGLPNYGEVVPYRVGGADAASALGAKAILVRSLTTDPNSPPHTGALKYEGKAPAVPAAAVSWVVADRLVELARKGPTVVRLTMEAHLEGQVTSGNVIAELRGRELPEEIVVFGGHMDSWDVGQGAHDNGAGVAISMAVLDLLRGLGLRPRRTLRLVLWTNEENGGAGSADYARRYGQAPHFAAVESDTGGARIIALTIQDSATPMAGGTGARPRGTAELEALAMQLHPEGVVSAEPGFAGADVAPLIALGVTGIGMRHELEHYFDVHHSANDTLDRIDPAALAQSVAVMASVVYALADAAEPHAVVGFTDPMLEPSWQTINHGIDTAVRSPIPTQPREGLLPMRSGRSAACRVQSQGPGAATER